MLRNVLAWIFAFALVVHFLADCLHLFQTRGKHYFVVLLDVIIDAILLFGFIYLMTTPWA
jgi:hypothetical protein